MTEWNVFLVIAEIIGLFVLVTKPILNLTASISSLDKKIALMDERHRDLEDRVDGLEDRVDELEDNKTKKHKELWEDQHRQDDMLTDHEHRLHDMDGKWYGKK